MSLTSHMFKEDECVDCGVYKKRKKATGSGVLQVG
jgi:hypothetical protein